MLAFQLLFFQQNVSVRDPEYSYIGADGSAIFFFRLQRYYEIVVRVRNELECGEAAGAVPFVANVVDFDLVEAFVGDEQEVRSHELVRRLGVGFI